MGITANIIKLLTPLVNPFLGIFRSKLFWAVLVGLGLLFWLTKGDTSKIVKIIKLLGKMGATLVALFLHLFINPYVKMFQEEGEA